MTVYAPGTQERDPQKQNMALQEHARQIDLASTNITTNTTNIATNTANIATNTANITTNTTDIATLQTSYPSSKVTGTATNNNAAAGYIGEYIESVVASGSAVALTTAVAKTITSISLTAGDWDVDSVVAFSSAATTSITVLAGSVSLTNNTFDITGGRFYALNQSAFVPGSSQSAFCVPPVRFSLSSTTTIFMVASATFTVSTLGSYGIIRARRVR